MKIATVILHFSILFFPAILFAQSIGIGTATPNNSAKLDVSSVSQGLLPPRMNFSQRNGIQNPEPGLIIYCTTCGIGGDLQVFSNGKWRSMINQPTSDSIVKPTLTTTPVSSITYNSAISGGIIINSGQLPVIIKGVVWDINPNPEVFLSTKTVDSIRGSVSFTSSISGLLNNTTYYVRAYSITDHDTSYGNELVFSTDAIIIEENFETQYATSTAPYNPISIENWQNLSEIGTKRFDARVFNNNKYAFLSGYGTNNGTIKTWLITKGIDVSGLNSKTLTFDTKQDFYMNSTGGLFPVPSNLKVLVSTNYSGLGDPWASDITWDDLTSFATLSPGSATSNYPSSYTPSGPIDISSYSGVIYIAFQYIGFDNPSATAINGDKTSAWEIDNIRVTGN